MSDSRDVPTVDWRLVSLLEISTVRKGLALRPLETFEVWYNPFSNSTEGTQKYGSCIKKVDLYTCVLKLKLNL